MTPFRRYNLHRLEDADSLFLPDPTLHVRFLRARPRTMPSSHVLDCIEDASSAGLPHVNLRIVSCYVLGFFESIPALRQSVLDRPLSNTDLDDGVSSVEQRFRGAKTISSRLPTEAGEHTVLSLSSPSYSPYPGLILSRSYFSVARRFRSFTHTHHRLCKSSKDLWRNSSTDHDRPIRPSLGPIHIFNDHQQTMGSLSFRRGQKPFLFIEEAPKTMILIHFDFRSSCRIYNRLW